MTVDTVVREFEADLVVRAVEPVAEGVVALSLSGDGLPDWTPGAHIDLILGDGLVRQYSLCGRTGDPGCWRIAVLETPDSRGGSRAVHRLTAGETVRVRGPRNHFPVVAAKRYLFLAGGIGITPFRAMIEDVITRGLEHRVELIHSNRTPEDAPFYAELTAWAKENPRFVYRPTMTDAGPGWTGERRKIGRELFGEWLPADRNAPVYYEAGPEGFVKAAVEQQARRK